MKFKDWKEGKQYQLKDDTLVYELKEGLPWSVTYNGWSGKSVDFFAEAEFEEAPWQPKDGECYYYPTFRYALGYREDEWCGSYLDINTRRTVGTYKTAKEAIKKAKKLGWIE